MHRFSLTARPARDLRPRFGGLVSVAIAALLCLAVAAATPAQAPAVIRVGTLKLVGGAPLFWGADRGYFRQEGLQVQFVYFGAAAPVATATVTGDIDVGATGITGTLFNLAAGGGKIYLVADRGQERPGYPLNAVVVTKAAYASGVRSLRDLRGKRIGITTLGSTFHYQIAKLLERESMTLQDVQLVPLREVNLVAEALRNGQIAAALLSPPWGAASEQEGWGKILFYAGDRIVNQVTGVFYGARLHNDHALGDRFMRGYVRATRDYFDACLHRPPRGTCGAIVALTARTIDQPEAAVAKSLPYIDRNARLYLLDLERQEAWYVQNGMASRYVPLDQFVDSSFVNDAVRSIGP
ncbi:MAG TPA: ABC transporter substrate-binding protein [bacterium]|nr:ABC transporter substrate-binding protein [bacterium]